MFRIEESACSLKFEVEKKSYPEESDTSVDAHMLRQMYIAHNLAHDAEYYIRYTKLVYKGKTCILQRVFTPMNTDTYPIVAHMHHDDLYIVMLLLSKLFKSIMNTPSYPYPAYLDGNHTRVAKFAYLFSLAAPFKRGSASILETFLMAYYKHHNYVYTHRTSDEGRYINPDLEAMMSKNYSEFLKAFPKSFEVRSFFTIK